MSIFTQRNTAIRDKYSTSRANLLAAFLFTFINIVLDAFGSSSYFLFSATVPYAIADLGLEFYQEGLISHRSCQVMIVIAVVLSLPYLLAWWRSKEKSGWMIFALVIFGLDTIVLAFFAFGDLVGFLMDIVFHAWVLYYLISGVAEAEKRKRGAQADASAQSLPQASDIANKAENDEWNSTEE